MIHVITEDFKSMIAKNVNMWRWIVIYVYIISYVVIILCLPKQTGPTTNDSNWSLPKTTCLGACLAVLLIIVGSI